MSGTTWTKFYWSDWESDPALRLCSLAAQGLWMRMLCIASAHDPIGYVAVAGRGLDETALARMTGCSGSEASELLGELDRNGVFSRDRTGRIYSRRMVTDARRAAIARKNGKRGGNPSLSNSERKTGSDNPPDNAPVKTQEPEATYQKERREPTVPCPAAPNVVVLKDDFTRAWRAYPAKGRERSKSQAKTLPIWREAAKAAGGSGRLADAVARYVREDQTHKGECGPPAFDRWLRDGRWEHWLPEARAPAAPLAMSPELQAARRALLMGEASA